RREKSAGAAAGARRRRPNTDAVARDHRIPRGTPPRATAPGEGAGRPRARAFDGPRRRLRDTPDTESARAELFKERIESVRRRSDRLGAPLDRARPCGAGGDDRRRAAARRVLLWRRADARRYLSCASTR